MTTAVDWCNALLAASEGHADWLQRLCRDSEARRSVNHSCLFVRRAGDGNEVLTPLELAVLDRFPLECTRMLIDEGGARITEHAMHAAHQGLGENNDVDLPLIDLFLSRGARHTWETFWVHLEALQHDEARIQLIICHSQFDDKLQDKWWKSTYGSALYDEARTRRRTARQAAVAMLSLRKKGFTGMSKDTLGMVARMLVRPPLLTDPVWKLPEPKPDVMKEQGPGDVVPIARNLTGVVIVLHLMGYSTSWIGGLVLCLWVCILFHALIRAL